MIGTAGWSIPRASAHRFAASGTHLQRYSSTLRCVEINSCFYRSHARATYTRWAAGRPPRFSLPSSCLERSRTTRNCVGRACRWSAFSTDRRSWRQARPDPGELPPALAFDTRVAGTSSIVSGPDMPGRSSASRGIRRGSPRPPTDCSTTPGGADRGRSGRGPGDGTPGGWRGISYFRLHGSPRTYWSRYDTAFIERLAREVLATSASGDVWCVFDNTAAGARRSRTRSSCRACCASQPSGLKAQRAASG